MTTVVVYDLIILRGDLLHTVFLNDLIILRGDLLHTVFLYDLIILRARQADLGGSYFDVALILTKILPDKGRFFYNNKIVGIYLYNSI